MNRRLCRFGVIAMCAILTTGCGVVGRSNSPREVNITGVVTMPIPDELQCKGPGFDTQRQCSVWGLGLSQYSVPYVLDAGTSFAAPYVSAAAGLLIAHGVPANQVESRLINTARLLGGGRALSFGAGLLDAAAALGATSRPQISVVSALSAMKVQTLRSLQPMSPRPMATPAASAAGRLYLQVSAGKDADLAEELTRRNYTAAINGSLWVIEGGFELERLGQDLQKAGLVEQATYSRTWRVFGNIANDAYINQQWALTYSAFPQAWNLANSLENVTVAVLDTGVDFQHPDLQGVQMVSPCSMVNDSTGALTPPGYSPQLTLAEAFRNHDPENFCWNAKPQDRAGHGTMVTGIIAATRNNGLGVSGAGYGAVNSRVQIMPVQVLDFTGSGQDVTVAYGIYYAVEQGADVINLSLGGAPGEYAVPELWEAVEHARANGVVVVAAAGNQGAAQISPPANIPYVVAVGAATIWGMPASYSNTGTELDLLAPGGGAFAALVLASTVGPDKGIIDVRAHAVTRSQGAFSLSSLPAGQYYYYYAWVDADLNNLMNDGDFYDVSGPHLARKGAPEVVALQLRRYSGVDMQVYWND